MKIGNCKVCGKRRLLSKKKQCEECALKKVRYWNALSRRAARAASKRQSSGYLFYIRKFIAAASKAPEKWAK